MFFEFMMHGLHPLSLSSVSVLSNHPICGGEPKFYQEADGYLVLMMTRRHLWWIWTLAHIMIFSNYIILKTTKAYLASSFPSGKVLALVSVSFVLIQVAGRAVSAVVETSLKFSTVVLQKHHASAFMTSITWLTAILRSRQPI